MKDADKMHVKHQLKEIERQTAISDLARSIWRTSIPAFIFLMFMSYSAAVVFNNVKVVLWPAASISMAVGVVVVVGWFIVRLGLLLVAIEKHNELFRDK